MTDTLHRILPQVQKPARYVGGEYNQIVKDKRDVDVRVAFCFPDTYEIGMSNIGMAHFVRADERTAGRVVRACVCALGRHGRKNA